MADNLTTIEIKCANCNVKHIGNYDTLELLMGQFFRLKIKCDKCNSSSFNWQSAKSV